MPWDCNTIHPESQSVLQQEEWRPQGWKNHQVVKLLVNSRSHCQLHEVLHSNMVAFVQWAAEGPGQSWQGWMEQRLRVHCNKVLDNLGYVMEEVSVNSATMLPNINRGQCEWSFRTLRLTTPDRYLCWTDTYEECHELRNVAKKPSGFLGAQHLCILEECVWSKSENSMVLPQTGWKEGLRSCGHIKLDAFLFRRESCKVPIIEPKLAAFAGTLLIWVSDRNETHITRQGTDRICKGEKQHTPSDRRHSSNQLGMKRFRASSRQGKRRRPSGLPPALMNESDAQQDACSGLIALSVHWSDLTSPKLSAGKYSVLDLSPTTKGSDMLACWKQEPM